MMIRFNDMPESVLEHFKGGDGALCTKMVADDLNRFMRGRLAPGSSIGMHTHEDSCEILYVISGVGTAILDGETEILHPGDGHYCPKGHTHTLMNLGDEDLIFFAVIPKQ